MCGTDRPDYGHDLWGYVVKTREGVRFFSSVDAAATSGDWVGSAQLFAAVKLTDDDYERAARAQRVAKTGKEQR